MVALAGEYGISTAKLATAYRKLGVPIPRSGYWAKKAAGNAGPLRPCPRRFHPSRGNEKKSREQFHRKPPTQALLRDDIV